MQSAKLWESICANLNITKASFVYILLFAAFLNHNCPYNIVRQRLPLFIEALVDEAKASLVYLIRARKVNFVFPEEDFELANAKIDELQGLWNCLDGVVCHIIAISMVFPLLARKLKMLLEKFQPQQCISYLFAGWFFLCGDEFTVSCEFPKLHWNLYK